jgi:hypothetical protein
LKADYNQRASLAASLHIERDNLRAQLSRVEGERAGFRAQLEAERECLSNATMIRRTLGANDQEYTYEAAARVVSERDAAIHGAQEREKEIKALKSESRLVLPASFLATNPLPWQSRDCGVIRSATNGIVGQINGRDVCDRVDTDVARLIVDAANRGASR